MLKEYLISICTAAIICAIVKAIPGPKGTASALIQLLCGVYMSITVLSPLISIPTVNLSQYWQQVYHDAQLAANIGVEAANEECNAVITERLQAYILEQAAAMGAEVTAEVFFDDMQLKEVRIIGTVSPYTKLRMSEILSTELGIPVEAQQWIE